MAALPQELKNKKIHILGVAGTLMGSFAAYLKKQGLAVTGSDQNIYPPMSHVLQQAGVEVLSGYSPDNLTKVQPDLVIVGNVIRKTNTEMEAVVTQKIPYFSLPHALETMILPSKHSLVVAGTHGKTTTTTLLAHILEVLGESPSFFIGGVPQNFSESFRLMDSKFMVLEGDEYDTAFFDKVPKFTHYKPQDAILTSIEFDHADIYKDMNAVISAFEKLATLIPPSGHLVVCGEAEIPLRVAYESRGQVVTYGFSPNMDSYAKNLELTPQGLRYKWNGAQKNNHDLITVELALNGRHNALNSLACLTLIAKLGLDTEKAVAALRTFQGIKRRQEVFGRAKGVTLIDDFAHHPTAVRETLTAIRAQFPSSRIIACFEPRSATSRRRVFQKAYSESFDEASLVYIAKPYDQTAIDAQEQFSSEELIQDLKNRGKKAFSLQMQTDSVKKLTSELRSGDVVLVMSNGSFDGLLPKLLQALTHGSN